MVLTVFAGLLVGFPCLKNFGLYDTGNHNLVNANVGIVYRVFNTVWLF